MNRREFRIETMKLLYILEFGGTYNKEEIDSEVYKTVEDIIDKTEDIENILNNSLVSWSLNRLNLVDKAILKICVYEMKYLKLAPQIAINEALEVTKMYSDIDGKQVSFNNKVLDRAKDLCL